jgi:hypothetical protein
VQRQSCVAKQTLSQTCLHATHKGTKQALKINRNMVACEPAKVFDGAVDRRSMPDRQRHTHLF